MIDEPLPRVKASPWGNYTRNNETMFEYARRADVNRKKRIARRKITLAFLRENAKRALIARRLLRGQPVLGRNLSRVCIESTFQRSSSWLINAIPRRRCSIFVISDRDRRNRGSRALGLSATPSRITSQWHSAWTQLMQLRESLVL